jgi:hypothetical protein
MEISKHITEEAESMLANNVALPAEIKGAPGFFLATHEDSTIQSFGSVEHNGLFYKIGSQRTAKTA